MTHQVIAVGSSSSVESAKKFAQEVGATEAKCYGSYEEVAQDPNVDVIYIASYVRRKEYLEYAR